MKIALLHYTSPPIVGGVESVIGHQAKLMKEDGHTVVIFSGRGEIFDSNIPVVQIPLLDSRNREVLKIKKELDLGHHFPAFDMLRDKIREILLENLQGFDILIAHNVVSLHKNLPLTAALYDAYTSPGFPHLILWHHDLAWTTPRYRKELHDGYPWDLLRTPWEGVCHVVVSALRQMELSRLLGIDSGSIRIISNGVDLETFFKLEAITIHLAKTLHLYEADPLLLLPVRLTPRKNIELALRILAELRKKYNKTMLLVTGPEGAHNPSNAAYRKKLHDLSSSLYLQDAAHFLADVTSDFLPDSVISDCYRMADALLLPSSEEGFGIPLIEAALSHIPVFCSDIPVLHELGGKDVTYFDLHAEPQIIAAQIIDRLESEATSRWSRRAKREYTWESIYHDSILPLLQEVIS